MKVYRYMSLTEFKRMLWGENIVGKERFNAKTNSQGVCFLPERIKGSVEDGTNVEFDPIEAFWFLYGIVSGDVLVEFEAEEDSFNHTYGNYAEPNTYQDMVIGELCIPYYNRDICKPLRYCVPDLYYANEYPIWWTCN